MKRFACPAVALLASTVVIGTLVQSASAATITWTDDTGTFVTVPVTFNPVITDCVGTCSNAVTGNDPGVDRSPFQNDPPGGAQAPGYTAGVYSAVQAGSSAIYDFSLGGAITILHVLWGSPDSFNNLEFWSGNPALAGSVDVGGLSGSAAHGGAVGGGMLPLASPLAFGHDLLTFSISALDDVDWLVFSTQANAFEYSFQVFTDPGFVPVPATLPLFATSLAGLGLLGWRRKRKARPATA